MNKELLLKTADMIEKASHCTMLTLIFDAYKPPTFNMSSYNCGTAGCIAYWGLLAYGLTPEEIQYKPIGSWAQEVLGLNDLERRYLFLDGFPADYGVDLRNLMDNLRGIEPEHAARVIRTFVKTGEINWLAYNRTNQ